MKNGRTAIVHIGHKKTGTTAIQHQFHAQRAALRERGVLYPLADANHSFALSGLFRGRNRALTASAKRDYAADTAGGLTQLDAELREAGDWSHVLFSAEALAGFSKAELAALRDWLLGHVETILVVFVIRDPVDWAVSVAQQNLKSRDDVAAILSAPEPVRWRQIVTRLRRVFGADALLVHEYEALAAVRERFVARFGKAVGLPKGTGKLLRAEQARVNESLSAEAAMLMARVNAMLPEMLDGARNPARSGMEMRAFRGLAGSRFDLPDATRRLAYAQSRDDVAFVVREFGITRYDYPEDDVKAGGYREGEVSDAFLDAVAARLVALNAEALAGQMLLSVYQARLRGDADGAAKALREVAERFPLDRRVVKELALAARGKV